MQAQHPLNLVRGLGRKQDRLALKSSLGQEKGAWMQ